jgi:glycerol-1-phosphate dehydrogenase [NAD(P)+]
VPKLFWRNDMSVWPLPRITFQELSSIHEARPVALLTSNDVWSVLSPQLTLPILIQAEPARYDRALFDYLGGNLPSQAKVVYAVGSGAPVEAAKVVASRNNVPLVVVPTALDSALPFMPAALAEEPVHDRKRQVYVGVAPAAEIIIDWGVVQAAPDALRGAGIVDVLSIVTGLLDWRYAAQKGKNTREQHFAPWAASVAAGLAKEAIKSSVPIGQGQRDALQILLDLIMIAVQLNNQLEHSRAQQGSEHYLAQILAASVYPDLAHAELVGPCLLFSAALHGQDPAPLREAMQNAGVRLDQVRATDFNLMLDQLPDYLMDYDFPYSILNDLDPQSDAVASALEASGLAILAETWQTPDDVAPEAVTPEAVTPEAVTPEAVTPEEAAPEQAPAVQAAPAPTTPDEPAPQPTVPEATQPVAAAGHVPMEAPREAIPHVEQTLPQRTGSTDQSQPTQQDAPASHEETQSNEGTAHPTNH